MISREQNCFTGLPIHYGWIIVAVGSAVLFSCFGLARYAYTMLIPGMQAGLGLSWDMMGFIGTGNFIGYLISVLLAPVIMRRITPRKTIAFGLALIAVSMIAISRSSGFLSALILYMLVGMGGGFANIPMMALVTYWFRKDQRGRAAGLVIGGNGAGIILAGYLVPLLNRTFGESGWRAGWMVLGVICLMAACCAALLLRNSPQEMGLEPISRTECSAESLLVTRERKGDGALLIRLGVIYLAFGATFMVYGTFIVSTMVREYGFSEARAGMYWSWVGFFSLFSGVFFGSLSDRIGRRWGLAVVFSVQSLAYLIAGLKPGNWGIAVSIVLYGAAVFAIPAVMTAAVADYLGLSRAASAFAVITLFFAAGQSVGPAVAGIIGNAVNSFAPAYLASSLITAAAALYSAALPKPAG